MADTFLLEIVSPTAVIFSDEVDMLTAPGFDGEFGVLKGHTDYLVTLKPGEIIYSKGSSTTALFITRGYSEVTPDKTTILVDNAEPTSTKDLGGAKEELRQAEEALKGLAAEDEGFREATERHEVAQALVNVLELKKGH